MSVLRFVWERVISSSGGCRGLTGTHKKNERTSPDEVARNLLSVRKMLLSSSDSASPIESPVDRCK